jgi:hypothetical protein
MLEETLYKYFPTGKIQQGATKVKTVRDTSDGQWRSSDGRTEGQKGAEYEVMLIVVQHPNNVIPLLGRE